MRIRALSSVVLLAVNVIPAAAEQVVRVVLDRATIIRIADGTSTLVVGNPLIADVSIASHGTMVVTGKGYGLTNVKLLDKNGSVLAEYAVQVSLPVEAVIVYRGIEQNSYSCAPDCERRITLGDSPDYFAAAMNQTVNRAARALRQDAPSQQQGSSAPPPQSSPGTAAPPL